MNATQMVAYNAQTGHFLRKQGKEWLITDSVDFASGYPHREMQLAVSKAQKVYPGSWMIMRRQDALKIAVKPRAAVPVETSFSAELDDCPQPVSISVLSGAERTQGSEEIVSLVSRLEAATSAARLAELSAQLSEYDKAVTAMYHYIEANKLSAAKGYQAYAKLRRILLKRRAVKNETAIIHKFRSGSMPSANQIEGMASRYWSPEFDNM